MATWIRVAVGDYETYLNMNHVVQAQVAPTAGGPAGYIIELGGEGPSDFGAVYARWDTAAEANAALRLLVRGIDLAATEGEEV